MQPDTPSSTVSPRSLVLIAMIACAIGARLINWYVPGVLPQNFTPVEATALFGGAYFADRRLAFIVPLAAMLLADLLISLSLSLQLVSDWLHTLPAVYLCIALTVFGGFGLHNKVSPLRVGAYGFASAVLFFIVTNFAAWLAAHPELLFNDQFAAVRASYPSAEDACVKGLAACYIAGIPFFKGTLYGTLFWSAALFGGFELMRRRWPSLQPAHA
ncbi:MAG: hypothetical protein JSS59_09970 [Proteobacteria bacterium]|uniref:DUF6580 family putative transport protein n=1 Tax=Rudaea sp. TaxID=2136325 RepID=UPI003784B247|nr:hypothetical protein [Pseudomonadota bacterium]